MAVALTSVSGIYRICRISAISGDGLVKALLRLYKAINEDAISASLKGLGQKGAHKLHSLLLAKNAGWLHKCGLKIITLNADSTVQSVCGNQEVAAKGYNTTKKGGKNEGQHGSAWERCVHIAQLSAKNWLHHTWAKKNRMYKLRS